MKRLKVRLLWSSLALLTVWQAVGQDIRAHSIVFQRYELVEGRLVQQLAAINPDGTGEQQIILNLPELGFPTWSRDGGSLALASVNPSTPFTVSRNVFAVDFQTAEIRRVTNFKDLTGTSSDPDTVSRITACTFPWYKAFSADKSRVAIASFDYTGITMDYTNGSDPGEPLSSFKCAPVLQVYDISGMPGALVTMAGLGTDTIHAGDGVDWAPDRDLLVYPKDIQMLVTDAYGQQAYLPATALFTLAPVDDAVLRGQAQQITFPQIAMIETWTGPAILWQTDFQPAFSPDGGQIAYIRSLMGIQMAPLPEQHSLRLVNVDGSNDHEILTFEPGRYTSHLSWSPNGRQIAFDQGNQAQGEGGLPVPMLEVASSGLFIVNADGSGLKQLRGPAAAWPAWYPGNGNAAPARLEVKLAPAPGKLVLSWPATAGNLFLQSSPRLGPNALWQAEGTQPEVEGNVATVTLNTTDSQKFYRLIQP